MKKQKHSIPSFPRKGVVGQPYNPWGLTDAQVGEGYRLVNFKEKIPTDAEYYTSLPAWCRSCGDFGKAQGTFDKLPRRTKQGVVDQYTTSALVYHQLAKNSDVFDPVMRKGCPLTPTEEAIMYLDTLIDMGYTITNNRGRLIKRSKDIP